MPYVNNNNSAYAIRVGLVPASVPYINPCTRDYGITPTDGCALPGSDAELMAFLLRFARIPYLDVHVGNHDYTSVPLNGNYNTNGRLFGAEFILTCKNKPCRNIRK